MIPVTLLMAFHLTGSGPAPSLPHSYSNVAPFKPKPVAKPKAKPKPQAPDAYGIYDSSTAEAIPKGKVQAVYSNGLYAAPVTDEKDHPRTLWIDVTGGNPKADVLDIESEDAGWWQAGPWAEAAYKDHPNRPVIEYTAYGTWAADKASVAEYAPNVDVKWWVASPSGIPHLVPGSSATQWYWGTWYNVSETTQGFWVP
jgi:hypothetical protein